MLTQRQNRNDMMLNFFSKIKSLHKKYWNKILVEILFPTYSIEELFPGIEKLSSIEPESVATPEVKQMNLVNFAKYLQADNYTIPDVYTYNLRQVIYYPKYELILTESRKILKEASYGFNVLKAEQISDVIKLLYFNFSNPHQLYPGKKLEKFSGVCSLVSEYFKNNHYHNLIDVAPKLYLLNQPEYQGIDEIKLLFSSEPTPIEKFLIEKLAPKNIKINVVEDPDSLYFVERLIFPTLVSRVCCGYLPSVYLDYFRDKVLPKREGKKINRIFISRSKVSNRRKIINEDELFADLKKYGFSKYILDDMSIETQIDLFYDADYVVGVHGAGLTNIIFSHKIKVLELFPTKYLLPHYYYLAKSLGHTYGYYSGAEADNTFTPNADFRVNVSKVVERLLELESKHQQMSC